MHVGSFIAGRFVIERFAGRGGMGAVFRALDTDSGNHVALKVLLEPGNDDIVRFDREARLIARLRHPAIARYVHHGSAEDGRHYLAMEWLEGEDLAVRLARGPLTLEESVTLAQRVALALEVVHAEGILHRDIKPSNLFLNAGRIEDVKLLDFGVARSRAATGALTGTGTILGTPAYMAPEQIRGERDIGPRVDLYALGCVLFECLAGRPPFEAGHPIAMLTKALFEEPPKLRDCVRGAPRILEALVAKLLEKDQTARPRSASEVAAALSTITRLGDESFSRLVTGESPSFGTRERRLVCIVLATPPGGITPTEEPLESRPTEAAEDATLVAAPDDIQQVAMRFSARFELLGKHHSAALLTGAASAHDLAIRGGRLAIALREKLPHAAVVVALGRDEAGSTQAIGEVIDRATSLIPTSREIVLDGSCARLLEARFEVARKGESFVLVETGKELSPRRAGIPATPCIGRDRELSMLEGLFDGAVGDPRASVALITAPAGAGKTRLRDELLQRIQRRGEEVEIWAASGDPMAAGSAFAMFSTALRSAVGLHGDDEPGVARDKLERFVGRFLHGEHATRVTRFLGELLELPFTNADEQLDAARRDVVLLGNQIRRACEDLLASICAVRPVLLVLDDLHWGDVATVKVVDGALRHLAESPFCVLAFARPEVDGVLPNLWSERNVQVVRLAPLGRKACERLATEMLRDRATDERIARVVERSGGNAFFLEELARNARVSDAQAFPETVLAMAQLRIEQLDAGARRLLRAASLFGQAFSKSALEAILMSSTTEIDGTLESLLMQNVVVTRWGDTSDEQSYAFRHAFLRDAAYEMLTSDDRASGHLRVAEWLDQQGYGDPLAIAQHFERGGASGRAMPFWIRVVEDAIAGNDLEGAVARGQHALTLGATDEQTGQLRLLLATACCWLSRFHEAEGHAIAAMDVLPMATASWYAAAERLNWTLYNLGRRDRWSWLNERMREAEPLDATTGERVIAWLALAEAEYIMNNVAAGDELLDHARRIASTCEQSLAAEARAAYVLGARAFALGVAAEARVHSERAVQLYRRLGDARNALLHQENLGVVNISLGNHAQATEQLWEALAENRRMGLQNRAAWIEHCIGRALVGLGQLDEGFAMMRRAGKALSDTGEQQRLWGFGRVEQAWLEVTTGAFEFAEKEVAPLFDADTPEAILILAHAIRAHAYLARNDPGGALEHARLAWEMQERTDCREYSAIVLLTLALALDATGARAEAEEVCRKAMNAVITGAAALENEEQRNMFFENVPENARAIALARKWGLS